MAFSRTAVLSCVRNLMLWIYHTRTRLSPDLRHQLWIAAPSGQASEPSGTPPTLLELEESSTSSDVSQCRGGSWLWVGQAPRCLERAVGTQTHPTCLSKSRSCGKVGLDSRPFYPTVVKPAQLQIDPQPKHTSGLPMSGPRIHENSFNPTDNALSESFRSCPDDAGCGPGGHVGPNANQEEPLVQLRLTSNSALKRKQDRTKRLTTRRLVRAEAV